MFIHIAMILTMIWVLNRTFFKPINSIIESRERSEGGYSGEAEQILGRVAEKDAEYGAGLLEARNEGYELIEKERNEAIKRKSDELASVKQKTAEHLASELGKLEKQTAEAESAIRKEAEVLAEKISSKILKSA